MVRAATLGAIDFSQFDPLDAWWWRKLHWITEELAAADVRAVTVAQHQHWLASLSNSLLKPEAYGEHRANANNAIIDLMKLAYPWMADQFGDAAGKTARDSFVEQYHELHGRPGEERYEEMLRQLAATLAKGKLSHREKEAVRAKRRKENAEAMAMMVG